MTLEATLCPDDPFRAEAVHPCPPDLADIESVEDALAAGIALPCQDHDPDLFFAEDPVEVERAKALCVDCPVRALCLEAAVARHEPWGVWGGEWFTAGVAVGHKRPRGRPRKDGSIGPRPAQRRPATARSKEAAA